MSQSLYGYGPHSITSDDDYDLKCVGTETRPQLLTIGLEFGTYDGNVTVKTRKQGSSESWKTQAYAKDDFSTSAAAVTANQDLQIDVTGKDVRLTTAGRSTGTLTVNLHLSNEL
jgi:hypothetical protein